MPDQVTVRVELGPYVLRGREVEHAEVYQGVGEHARCELAFLRDPRAVASPVAALRLGELAGASVRVVFVADGGDECLAFEGRVREAEIDHLATGAGRVTVLGASESYALAEHVEREYLREQTLPGIAGRLGVRLDGAVPAGAPRDYVRPGVSAWAFLAEAAAQEGLQLRARWPRTPGGAADQPAELGRGFAEQTHQLVWGRELAELAIGLAPVNAGVTGAFYDPAEKHDHRFRGVRAPADYLGGAAPVVAAAGSVLARDADGGDPGHAEPGLTTGVRARTMTEFRERLTLESARRAGAAVRARGMSVAPSLRAGDRVQIVDASAFSTDGAGGELQDRTGVFGLVAVTHRWTGSLYENAFTATPWAGYHPAPAAAGLDGTSPDRGVGYGSPAGGGGYTLAVVTDDASPDGTAGVRVRYAWMSEGEESDWIRVAGLGGGNTRGVGVLPSVGDEVVVVAVAGDPEHPVVVGALWNGVDKAWHEPGRHVWVTPAGNALVFLEDKPGAVQGTAETAELYTPAAKAWMQLAQKGPTGVPTITLHSEGDLSLEAPNGELRLSAKRYVAHVSGEHSTMVGKDLVTKAQGAVTLESGARLAMKSGADVAVRAGGALHAHASDSATIVGSQVAMNPPGATAPSITATVPALAKSAWGPRPVPKPGPGRSTEDPRTPTQKELAGRAQAPTPAGNAGTTPAAGGPSSETTRGGAEAGQNTPPVAAPAPPGPQPLANNSASSPCTGYGFSDPARAQSFADAFKALQTEWPQLTPDQRHSRVERLVNAQLSQSGVPHVPIQGEELPNDCGGFFAQDTWSITVPQSAFDAETLPDKAAAELAEVTYHEARHAEQLFLIARRRATQGSVAAELKTDMDVPRRVAIAAQQDPLNPASPIEPGVAALDAGIYGPGNAHRNAVLEQLEVDYEGREQAKQTYAELEKQGVSGPALEAAKQAVQRATEAHDQSYAAYRALPEEADAWATASLVLQHWA